MKDYFTKIRTEGNAVERLIEGCSSESMIETNAVERLNER